MVTPKYMKVSTVSTSAPLMTVVALLLPPKVHHHFLCFADVQQEVVPQQVYRKHGRVLSTQPWGDPVV